MYKIGAKYLTLILLMLLANSALFANEGRFYIYGKCTFVSGEELDGFISFGSNRLWISNFTGEKLKNPYAKLFEDNRSITFGRNNRYTPDSHNFTCRYSDIKKMRPIANNRLEVTIKDNRSIDLFYRFSNNLVIHLPDNTYRVLNWEDIVSINFTNSPDVAPKIYPKLYVGNVKSSQGVCFGIIEGRNYSNQNIPIEFFRLKKDGGEKISLSDVNSLEVENIRDVLVKEGKNSGVYLIKNRSSLVRVILPTIGNIDVPWGQIINITKSDISRFNGGTYNDSPLPKRLTGSVTMKNDNSYSGALAYDLDEALNIEFIEGKNNGIIYRLQLEEIKSIEPRNYKYSLIILKSGGSLSLGDSQDVNSFNNGILMLNSSQYIPWREVSLIEFQEQ